MEVDAVSFPHHLTGLLVNISEAEFVSFDLELTGIPSHLPNRKQHGRDKRTLEDRYAETKEAAEKYQIIQVGITCARFDYIANKYVLRPYNITISPLLDERLDIEREFCIQTGAASFLLNNGFNLGAPFSKGVQYLSREEAERARQMSNDRLDKKNLVEDLHLKDEDVDSLDFVRRAREAIVKWKAGNSLMLEITTHTGHKEQPLTPAISRFEKRLVHQLVRAEFPDLVSIGKSDCIRIIDFDPIREAENTKKIKKRIRQQIARQTGFRWVVEALAGGDIHSADPRNAAGLSLTADASCTKERFDRAEERLKRHQPVLVGHNMFTDLVYFYQTFISPVPETLSAFCEAIHELFPRIVDTKFLATHAEGDLNASPTLQEIAEQLDKQPLPDIATHTDHSKYHNSPAFHEAGYDSLLTATIMLRLSAKINVERQNIDPLATIDDDSDTSFKSALEDHAVLLDGREKVEEPMSLPPAQDPENAAPKKKRRGKPKPKKSGSSRKPEHRFHTKNLFDQLRDLKVSSDSGQESTSEEDQPAKTRKTASEEAAVLWQDEPYVQNTSGWKPIEAVRRAPMEMIPAFGSDFWNGFGNTLRVYGTKEAVLRIADW